MKISKITLEEAANNWRANGLKMDDLLSEWDTFAAICWTISKGTTIQGFNGPVQEFIKASEHRLGRYWWDGLLNRRGSCKRCWRNWKYENLSICTNCKHIICPHCKHNRKNGLIKNGHGFCTCGGEIVG